MEQIRYEGFETGIHKLRLKVLDHGYLHGDAAWHHTNIQSPFNRLYLVESGVGFLLQGDAWMDLLPGWAYLIPANSTCSYRCPHTIRKFYIHFRLEALPGRDLFEGVKSCLKLPFSVAQVLLKPL